MRLERRQSRLWNSGAVLGLAVMVGASGCKSNQTANAPAPIVDANGGPDPATVNNAPVSGATSEQTGYAVSAPASRRQPARVLGQQAYAPPPTSSGEQYPEQTAPAYPAGQGQPYPAGNNGGAGDYDAAYDQQVDAGQDALYASQPPPPLPEYQQPELTDPGDQWTPGYWSYAPQGYYWVPGAWVAPPFIGALWTPGYWGSYGGRYRFHHGFWGQHIGFYGGVPYGFGYTGHGYEGGYWNGNRFFYNNAVNRVNLNVVHNVYERNVTVANNTRVSYNGPGGWNARPTASDMAVLHEQRVPAMQVQRQRAQEAAGNRQQFAAENHGRPAMAVLAERQPADRVAPAALAPIGRPEARNAQRPGGFGPGNGVGRTLPEQGRGQGFGVRGDEPQPANVGRPAQQEQIRPGYQTQPARPQPEAQPRAFPEAGRPTSNPQRTPASDQQRQLQGQPRQDLQRPVPSQAQPVRPQPQARPEVQPEPTPRAQPQVQPRPEPQVQPQPRPQVQPQPQPRPQPQPQSQPRPQPQPQSQPRPQPQAQPHPQPQPHAQPAPHAEESHPHR